MPKPFFYRIEAADFFTITNSFNSDKELGKFIRQFSVDLITKTGTSDFAKQIIAEAVKYIDKKRMAGREGGNKRVINAKAKPKQRLSSASSKQQASTEAETKDRNKIPPPFEMVKAYCAERGNNVDPEKWFNHYSAKGWKVGNEKMVDWQAAVRTWEKTTKQSTDQIKEDAACPSWY